MKEQDKSSKKRIVISAVNFFSGGPLTILQDCLSFLENSATIYSSYSIIALVHDAGLLPAYKNITVRSFPKPRGSWLQKLKHEYVNSKKISKEQEVYLWLSLHDMTPSVVAERRAVYCHNPAPFYKASQAEKQWDKGFALFTLFYKYLYAINIRKNNFIIVQQDWIREKFTALFAIPASRIIVAHPEVNVNLPGKNDVLSTGTIRFLYPALPRVFKNFEVIVEAAAIVKQKADIPFEVIFTIHGTENKYAAHIKHLSFRLPAIKLAGLQNKEGMNKLYQQCSCVLFSSKLETWGLPITEAKTYSKALLVADLPYAKETVGTYEQVSFFHPDNANQLAQLMIDFLERKIHFSGNKSVQPVGPFSENWQQTFELLLR